jgi:hypothetical protein
LSLKKYKKFDKISEKIKYFSEKDSFKIFSSQVEKRFFSLVWKIMDEDYICMDGIDIAKRWNDYQK